MQKILQQQAEQVQRQTEHLREIEKHAATDKIVQAAQVYTSYKSLKDNDKMVTEIADLTKATEEGLLKKTGDGLNSNIIKLTNEMRKAFRAQQDAVKQERKDYQRAQPVDNNIADRAAKQAALYQMGGKGYLKDKFKDLTGMDKVTGLRDVGKAGKGLFSLENIFNLDDPRSQGLLGQIIRAKIAKNKYIENQLKTGAAPDRKTAARQYESVNKYRGELRDIQKEIERRKAEGATDEDLKREGYTARMEKAERAIAIADPNYRAQRADDINAQKVVPFNPAEKVTGLSKGTSTEETENENIRLMNQQNETLNKIEENTRPLGDILKFLEKSFEDLLKVMKDSANQNQDGGSILDSLGNRIPGRGRGRPVPGRTPGRKPGSTRRPPGRGVPGRGRGTRPGIPGRGGVLNRPPAPSPNLPSPNMPSRAPGRWPAPAGPSSPLPGPKAPGGLMTRAGGLLSRAAPLARFAGPVAGVIGAGYAGYQIGSAAYEFAQETGMTRPAEAIIDKAFGQDPNEDFNKLEASSMAKKNNALKGSGYTATTGGGYKGPDGKAVMAKDLPPELKGKLNALKIPGLNIPEATKATKATAPAPKAGDAVANTSAANAAARDQKAAAPVVVSAPTTTNVQQTSNYAPKYPARNTDSSIQQYNKERYGY